MWGPSKNDPKVAQARPVQRAFASTFLGTFGDFEAVAAEGLLDFLPVFQKSKSLKTSSEPQRRRRAPPQVAELKFELSKNEVVRQAFWPRQRHVTAPLPFGRLC